MKPILLLILLTGSTTLPLRAAPHYSIVPNPTNNTVTVSYTNNFFTGVCTVEGFDGGSWVPLKNFFTRERIGQATVALPTNSAVEYRLRCLSVAPGNAFVNLARAYGVLSTVAGNGQGNSGNNWLPQYEGALATEVTLSNPSSAVADPAGNIYIADRGSHAVLRVTPDGRIRTIAGTHQPGFPTVGGVPNEGIVPGTNSPLNSPTSLFYVNSSLIILDSGNSRIRVLDQFGNLATIAQDPTLATNLMGLWVEMDDFGELDQIYYGATKALKRYTLGERVFSVIATNFLELGSVTLNPEGQIIVTDVARHRVYRARETGDPTAPLEVVAGSGFLKGASFGNAMTVPLPGARSVAFLPIGGYFIGLDEPSIRQGARVWYVDANENAVPFIFGRPGVHAGDGAWFQKGMTAPKISTVKSLSLAPSGDIILVEGNGFVRKVEFLRIKR